MPNSKAIFWGVVISILFVSVVVSAFFTTGNNQFKQKSPDDLQVKKDIANLQRLVREKNLGNLRAFQKTIDDHWKNVPEIRAMLLSDLCKALNSEDFGDAKSALYARNCAKDALKTEDGLSVDLEYDMLRILQEIEEYRLGVVHGEDVWTKDRGERIALLVRFAKRMESQYDPTFDFKDSKNMPAGDLCPPAPNYVCGTKPEDIRDVAIRDEYITAIERNNAKARRFNAQLQIHRLIPMFPGFIDRFVIGLYTQPPSDRVHLIQALDQLRILDDRRTAIMKAVDSVIPPK